jgi:hypothetical protein
LSVRKVGMNICLPYSQIWLSQASGQSLVSRPDALVKQAPVSFLITIYFAGTYYISTQTIAIFMKTGN